MPPSDSNATIAWLAEHCRHWTIEEKWLLVEHLRVGQQWKDRLTRSGCWHINLHAKTMRLLVNELAAGWLAERSLTMIGRSGLEMLVDRVLEDLCLSQQLGYFQWNDAAHSALSRLLVRTYNDWRLAGLSNEPINPAALEVSTKADDLTLIFTTIGQRLVAARQVDYAGCIEGVIAAIQDKRLRLPPDLIVLLPESYPLTKRERDLLEILQQHGAQWHAFATQHAPSDTSTATMALATESADWLDGIEIQRQVATCDVNEVRGVLQHCFASPAAPTPLDQVEVLVSNYERYAPLVLENLWQWLTANQATDSPDQSEPVQGMEKLPVTFAEGIACIYSRPGRLLRSWIRWAEGDYLQAKAVQILREGLLVKSASAAEIGYARLANTLRRVPIGFGLDRYFPQVQRELESAQRDAQRLRARDSDFQGDCGSANLQAVLTTLEPLVRLAPQPGEPALQLLESARQLLMHFARAETIIDRYARSKLIDDIEGMQSIIRANSEPRMNMRAWLEQLPGHSRLFSSSPRPGALHLAPLEQGGAGGRPRVFMLGLDDRKFPRQRSVDPILLDAERQRLSPDMQTSDQLLAHQHAAVERVLRRLQGTPDARAILSYSSLEVIDDSENFASPILSRVAVNSGTGNATGSEGPASTVSFIAEQPAHALSSTESFLHSLLVEPDAQVRATRVAAAVPRLATQRIARSQQWTSAFSAFDGWVPQAGVDLLAGATSRPMSPSRLEMLGTCPRKYFFARALSVVPPDQWDIDPDRWLTALDMGTLLHELFEAFLRELQAANEQPDPARHRRRLLELLDARLTRAVAQVPVHNAEAYQRQCEELRETCEIFLEQEAAYVRNRQATTWIMEASLGSLAHSQDHPSTEIDTDKPIAVELTSGRQLLLCGRIDRIDRSTRASNPDYFIWDYKTGSAWGYDPNDAVQQGRKLQPFLYTRMLAARLQQLGRNPQAVQSFGYFFPSPRTEGWRLEWTVAALASGNDVLEHMLDLLSAGTFIATNEESDCNFCDYQNVCGSTDDLVQISNLKSGEPQNTQLHAWRQLRAID